MKHSVVFTVVRMPLEHSVSRTFKGITLQYTRFLCYVIKLRFCLGY